VSAGHALHFPIDVIAVRMFNSAKEKLMSHAHRRALSLVKVAPVLKSFRAAEYSSKVLTFLYKNKILKPWKGVQWVLDLYQNNLDK